MVNKNKLKDQELDAVTKERDSLRLKNEILSEYLSKNNIKIDL